MAPQADAPAAAAAAADEESEDEDIAEGQVQVESRSLVRRSFDPTHAARAGHADADPSVPNFKRFKKSSYKGKESLPRFVTLEPYDGGLSEEAESWFRGFNEDDQRNRVDQNLGDDLFKSV